MSSGNGGVVRLVVQMSLGGSWKRGKYVGSSEYLMERKSWKQVRVGGWARLWVVGPSSHRITVRGPLYKFTAHGVKADIAYAEKEACIMIRSNASNLVVVDPSLTPIHTHTLIHPVAFFLRKVSNRKKIPRRKTDKPRRPSHRGKSESLSRYRHEFVFRTAQLSRNLERHTRRGTRTCWFSRFEREDRLFPDTPLGRVVVETEL
ncbi:hypothetical protein F5B20DRAFT_155912 [Whalleya microplaca]|nr:hypothetical protein F5B20DRAFT_155912 [Whalleya microplaca]